MQNIVIIINILASIALIVAILLQQGKGAEMGASFGAGASQTVFGSQGSGSVFVKVTVWLAIIFFCSSIWLAVQANKANDIELEPIISGESLGLDEELSDDNTDSTVTEPALNEGLGDESSSTDPSNDESLGEDLNEGLGNEDESSLENEGLGDDEIEPVVDTIKENAASTNADAETDSLASEVNEVVESAEATVDSTLSTLENAVEDIQEQAETAVENAEADTADALDPSN